MKHKQNKIHYPIEQTLLASLNNKRKILVAFSGGVDSTVLLFALNNLKTSTLSDLKLRAIYIHHGLSDNADNWAEHCQSICDKWQIQLIIEKVQINKQKSNIEEQARNARYQAIYHHLQPDEYLCTAQHLDDQSETFLLALKRGSGPAGLSAMPSEKQHHLRPLLTISRQQIEDYALAHNLIWVEDESNQEDKYDRNFLRLHIFPQLTQRWPHFTEMVARSAQLCHEQESLIQELLTDKFKNLVDEQGQFNILPLKAYSEYKRNALLRMWFRSQGLNMPSRVQLSSIWQMLILAKQDANPQFILDNKQIRRYKNKLYVLPFYQIIEHIVLNWSLASSLTLPDNLGKLMCCFAGDLTCRIPNSDEKVSVRFYAQGKFNIVGRKGSRSLKKLWQEFDIAPWQRTRIPLIYYNEQLICAVGVFVTEAGQGSELAFKLQ